MHSTFRISLKHEGCEYMMTFKPNQTRIYDGEGFKRRAACLCFKNEKEDEVLLVSSSRHPDQWIVPGGGMEPEEEPCGAAVREVYEEAGVKGKLGRLLGVFEHNQDRKHRTYVYVLTVTETLEDWEDSVNIGGGSQWGDSTPTGAGNIFVVFQSLRCGPSLCPLALYKACDCARSGSTFVGLSYTHLLLQG
ncbi:diphosphoinositol polyphosphate phosphohydrolase 3-beta-like isoform 5-T5 [Salvelinus alpinus]